MKTILCLAFFLASGRQIAYVDLTVPPKTPELSSSEPKVYRSSGGRVYDRRSPDPQTLPISVRLERVLSPTKDGVLKDSVEVLVTNTTQKEITIPIGADPVPILAPYANDRRDLRFTVFAGDPYSDIVGTTRAVSSSAYPDSVAHLAPGDSVTYRIPIERYLANKKREKFQGAALQLTVWVQPGRTIIDEGSDLHADVGEEIRSSNSLSWPGQ